MHGTNHGAEPGEDRLRPLVDLYAALDRELARRGATCAGCGACCHFETAGHILYASRLERELLAGIEPPVSPDAGSEAIAAGWRCPFQKGNRCLAREARVLGCRLHFCEGGAGLDELAERWHERLKRLHDELGVAWDYRPLLPLGAVGGITNSRREQHKMLLAPGDQQLG